MGAANNFHQQFPATWFPKILQKFSEGHIIISELLNIVDEYWRFSKINQRLLKTPKEDSRMLWWHTNKFNYSWKVKNDWKMISLYNFYWLSTTCGIPLNVWINYCKCFAHIVPCPVELRDDSEGGVGNIAHELIKQGLVTATEEVQHICWNWFTSIQVWFVLLGLFERRNKYQWSDYNIASLSH